MYGTIVNSQRSALLTFADEIQALSAPMSDDLCRDCCGARLIMRAGQHGGTVESVFGLTEVQLNTAIMQNKSIAPESRNTRMAEHLRGIALHMGVP